MYNFQAEESASAGVRRIAVECLDDALIRLAPGGEGMDERVHEARKRLKELRALLRLARGALPRDDRRLLDCQLRDAGRALSAARDAAVRLATLESLAQGLSCDISALEDALSRDRETGVGALWGGELEVTRTLLRSIRDGVEDWHMEHRGWRALAPGLRWIYAKGQRGLCEAVEHPRDDEVFHDWRRRAKDQMYAVRLLTPAWPEVMSAWDRELHRLSELLGLDHDVAVLSQWLQSAGAPAPLLKAAEARQAALKSEALLLGRKIYAESTGDWLFRMEAWWEVWVGR